MPQGMDSVFDWVNQFSFSRPMKNTARDFSDAGTLLYNGRKRFSHVDLTTLVTSCSTTG